MRCREEAEAVAFFLAEEAGRRGAQHLAVQALLKLVILSASHRNGQ